MRFSSLALALVAGLLATPAIAQTGDCALGTASVDLDYSGVRARLFNKGNLFFDGGTSVYEVPKDSGLSPLFASTVWISGRTDGELRTAVATYAQGEEDYELYPGPLDEAGNPPTDCIPFDRIWKVNVDDVAAFENDGTTTPDLLDWPVSLGAPVLDGDGVEGNYDLNAGDRPRIYGSETAFWVMNDVAGPHHTTLSEPIGLEVRVTAFVQASDEEAFDRATFYRYELVYRGEAPLEEAYFMSWNDTDLGNFSDDYLGTDSTRGMAFMYNADNDDEEQAGGYGLNPPAIGVDLLRGAGYAMHHGGNTDSRTGNPDTAEDFYNYMQARWMDGSPLTEGGNGTDPEGTPISFVYPGDPVVPDYWSARCPTPSCTSPLQPADRRTFITTPSFTLQPGETQTVDLAILFARGADHLDSVTELKAASDAVQTAYNAGALFDDPMPVAAENPVALPDAFTLDAPHPNPFRAHTDVTFEIQEPGPVHLAVFDVLGRQVRTLADGPLAAGAHRARFDSAGLAPGVYLVVLETRGQRQTRKVLLVR